MNIEQITNKYFYSRIIERIKTSFINNKSLTPHKINKKNSEIIGNILKDKINLNDKSSMKKQPYLLNDKTIEGLIKNAKFSYKSLIFGEDFEIDDYLSLLFKDCVYYLLTNDNEIDEKSIKNDFKVDNYKYKRLVLDCLIDYVPFATFLGYIIPYDNEQNIATEKSNKRAREKYLLPLLYPEYKTDSEVQNSYGTLLKKAMHYLYIKCNIDYDTNNKYTERFKEFTHNIKSTTKLPDKIKKELIINTIIPLLKNNLPNESSIGLRVYNMIKYDFHILPFLSIYKDNSEYYQDLIVADMKYIEYLNAIFNNNF